MFVFLPQGTQVPSDGDDEETDMKDEALVLSEMFLLADDDLKQFFSAVPEGTRVTVTTDCCHRYVDVDPALCLTEAFLQYLYYCIFQL